MLYILKENIYLSFCLLFNTQCEFWNISENLREKKNRALARNEVCQQNHQS